MWHMRVRLPSKRATSAMRCGRACANEISFDTISATAISRSGVAWMMARAMQISSCSWASSGSTTDICAEEEEEEEEEGRIEAPRDGFVGDEAEEEEEEEWAAMSSAWRLRVSMVSCWEEMRSCCWRSMCWRRSMMSCGEEAAGALRWKGSAAWAEGEAAREEAEREEREEEEREESEEEGEGWKPWKGCCERALADCRWREEEDEGDDKEEEEEGVEDMREDGEIEAEDSDEVGIEEEEEEEEEGEVEEVKRAYGCCCCC